jgi:predicted phosphoadenosine phosphosulfate sulfurtransferase
MEFEEFVPEFGEWYAQGVPTCCFVGIRTDESLNRWRTIASKDKVPHDGLRWTTVVTAHVVNAYPIFDWRVEDLWTYAGKTGKPYNRLYDRMHLAGLTLSQMRICQPYGDDQRRGLYLFHLIEPDTWARVVARVSGANSGALYVRESGNFTGNVRISKPTGHTWQTFAGVLLESLPPQTREHFKNKIAHFLHFWGDRGYPDGIPDEMPASVESSKVAPSWRRICKSLLRNDYWCKWLSFAPQRSTSLDRYMALMKKRRGAWGIYS